MMKRFCSILLTALLVLGLTACSGASGSNSAASDSAPNTEMDKGSGWSAEMPKDDMLTEDSNAAVDDAADGDVPDTGSGVPGASALQNAKVIYTGELYLETKDFDAASADLDAIVDQLGGYYERRSLNQGGSYRSLYATVRIPAEHFNTFLTRAGETAHLTDKQEYVDDISEAYYDTESRLTTQRTKLARLQELLEQAESMEDIITLESAISDTELTIEHLTGSLRKYDSLVGFSTVTVTLNEVYRLSSDEAPVQTFGQRLEKAFSRGLEQGVENAEDFIIYIARNWLSLLLTGGILAGAVILVCRGWRKRRANRAPKPTAPKDADK